MDGGLTTSSRRIVGADGSGCTMPGSAHPAARRSWRPPYAPRGRHVGARSAPWCGWLKQLPKVELCSRLLDYSTESRVLIINTATRYSSADIVVSGSGLILISFGVGQQTFLPITATIATNSIILLQMFGCAANPVCLQRSATAPITLGG